MGFKDFLNKTGIFNNPDEDYDDDFDEEYDDEYEEEKPKRGLFGKKASVEEDDDDLEETVAPVKPVAKATKTRPSNIVPVKNGKGLEVCVIKPSSIDDAREITDTLLSGKAVVLNFEGVHVEIAQRIIDFTSGASYSIDGTLQKVTNYIFIATPASVEVSGDLQNVIASTVNLGTN